MMTKLIASFAVAAVVATAAVGTSAPAEAYYRHYYGHHYNAGPGIAAGIIGGIALGTIIASQRPAYYDDDYVYERPYYNCHRVLYERSNGERYWRRICD
ncbi:MAG: hypothetical protein P4L98_05855 [Ancalomicrobiaceae bacterium]|nr:hypothetical protein [Ancalomicrobiaceae bacterium]